MLLTDTLSLFVIGLTLGAQLISRSFLVRYLKTILVLVVANVFLVLTAWSLLLYGIWRMHPLSQYLLPPYENIDYFLLYIGERLFSPWLITLGVALLAPILIRALNKKMSERFFEREEPWLFALGIFTNGYPGFIFYFIALAIFGLVFALLAALRGSNRTPFYYLWLTAALFVMIMRIWVIPTSFLLQFNL